jgi:hypothetical protein
MVVCYAAADVRTILLLGEVSDCLLSARDYVRPFTDKQVELVADFAV